MENSTLIFFNPSLTDNLTKKFWYQPVDRSANISYHQYGNTKEGKWKNNIFLRNKRDVICYIVRYKFAKKTNCFVRWWLIFKGSWLPGVSYNIVVLVSEEIPGNCMAWASKIIPSIIMLDVELVTN